MSFLGGGKDVLAWPSSVSYEVEIESHPFATGERSYFTQVHRNHSSSSKTMEDHDSCERPLMKLLISEILHQLAM